MDQRDAAAASVATIKPFAFHDELTGQTIAVEVSPYYSKLIIDRRIYYFDRETGEFDGTSAPMGDDPQAA